MMNFNFYNPTNLFFGCGAPRLVPVLSVVAPELMRTFPPQYTAF